MFGAGDGPGTPMRELDTTAPVSALSTEASWRSTLVDERTRPALRPFGKRIFHKRIMLFECTMAWRRAIRHDRYALLSTTGRTIHAHRRPVQRPRSRALLPATRRGLSCART